MRVQSSYELQVQHYTQYIQENPKWDFAGIYADEGISGTSVLHREHFKRMISDCRAGKIDFLSEGPCCVSQHGSYHIAKV